MIYFYQDEKAHQVTLIDGQLVGPAPREYSPYHYTCTTRWEWAQLRCMGINARLTLEPGQREPWEIEAEARRKWEAEHSAGADPRRE